MVMVVMRMMMMLLVSMMMMMVMLMVKVMVMMIICTPRVACCHVSDVTTFVYSCSSLVSIICVLCMSTWMFDLQQMLA